MNKKNFTRILCFLIAIGMLVSSAVLAVTADSSADQSNTTDKSISEYASKLSTINYDEYMAEKFESATPAEEKLSFDLTDNWTYISGDKSFTITCLAGVWKMTKGDTIYTTKEDAVAAGYALSDLCYVTEYDGKTAVYTPDTGSISWTINPGYTKKTLVSISLDYYPVVNKATSIEREFYLNNEAPFSEARALTLSKIWSSKDQDETPLTASYTVGKKENADEIIAKAIEAGFASSQVVKKDDKTITFVQPTVITSKLNAFIDQYELRFFTTDANDNELRPNQVQTPVWTTYYMADGDGFDHSTEDYASNYFGFVMEAGEISIRLDGVNEPLALSSINLLPYEGVVSYDDYIANILAKKGGSVESNMGQDIVKIEAEYTSQTSTNVVYPVEDRTSAATTPCDTSRTLLNTIGTEKWETAGQWVEYSFQVNSTGFYDIYTRFRQSYLDGMYVNRSMEIFTDKEESYFADGIGYYNGAPFAEAVRLRYNYDNNWQVTSLSASSIVTTVNETRDNQGNVTGTTTTQESFDTNDMKVYFVAGVTYTIRLQVTLGSMSDLIAQIEDTLDALNKDYLTIIKLTGTSPDDYRDYSFKKLLPDTLTDMIKQANALDKISNFLKESADVASTYSGICDKLSNLLRKMALDEDEIAKNLTNFKSYVGSLGTFLTDAKTQPLQVDFLVIQPASEKAPVGKPNFFRTMWHEIKSFFASFFRDYNSLGAMETGDNVDSIDVWVPYGRDQANVIRNLATNDFTAQYNISVDLKLVTGGTLLPSILAGRGPDVYLGLGQETVINYAIRGALLDVADMEGYAEHISNFNDAAMNVLMIADADGDMHTYGLPETQGFNMMFVRYDILSNLGIEIPKTWEDIYVAQSKLEANNMEIGVTVDYQVHLYQLGGDLWTDDGMRINLDSVLGLKAFNIMCDMFTQYSFPYSYDAANRFRTGEMPIIIAGYCDLYNKLKVFATEIEGCWTFVPLPGYEKEDGTIDNSAISGTSAIVMISSATDKGTTEEAWTFMKWYTGAETQISYANEMVAIIGDSAKHTTANREALKSMPWTHEEYEEVSKQFENLVSVRNYPGCYIIGRYTEFAFLDAYNNDADPTTEILSYINIINSEITRKREEFNLETLDFDNSEKSESTLAEKRISQAKKAIKALQNTLSQGDTTYDAAIKTAKYGLANNAVMQLRDAANQFMDLCEANWDNQYVELTKVSGKTATVPSYYINVSKQTAEKKNGGYSISSLKGAQLLYFISECLNDAADALASY